MITKSKSPYNIANLVVPFLTAPTGPDGIRTFDKPNISYFVYVLSNGTGYGTFVYCRESFAGGYYPLVPNSDLSTRNVKGRIAFVKKDIDIKNVNKFFDLIEKQLGPQSRIKFSYTDSPHAIGVVLPEFWYNDWTRFHFLTLFLRCAAHHYLDEDEVYTALTKYNLAAAIIPAIKWFLDGNTAPTFDPTVKYKDSGNWQARGILLEFSGKSSQELAKLLKKPATISSEPVYPPVVKTPEPIKEIAVQKEIQPKMRPVSFRSIVSGISDNVTDTAIRYFTTV